MEQVDIACTTVLMTINHSNGFPSLKSEHSSSKFFLSDLIPTNNVILQNEHQSQSSSSKISDLIHGRMQTLRKGGSDFIKR